MDAKEGDVEVKRKPGRPQEFFYTEDKAEKMFEIFAQGGDIAEVCLAFGIKSKKTFHNHLNSNEQMKEDYEAARMARESFLRQMGMDVLKNPHHPKYKNFNTKLFMWTAANMAPDVFSHNVNQTVGGNTYNIGSVNTVNKNIPLEHDNLLQELELLAKDPELLKELKELEPGEAETVQRTATEKAANGEGE